MLAYFCVSLGAKFGTKVLRDQFIINRRASEFECRQITSNVSLCTAVFSMTFAFHGTIIAYGTYLSMVGMQGLEPWVSRPPAWRFTN